MNRKLFTLLCCAGFMLVPHLQAQTYDRLPGYVQAEKFTKDKLSKMLFSTTVDPHWFQQGNCFWYEYKQAKVMYGMWLIRQLAPRRHYLIRTK